MELDASLPKGLKSLLEENIFKHHEEKPLVSYQILVIKQFLSFN